MTQLNQERCRLVLITPESVALSLLATQLKAAVDAGDVASVIVPQYKLEDDQYQALLEQMVEIGQGAGAAVVAAGDSRIAGRCSVDGVHVKGGHTELRSAIKEFGHKWIVGCGGAENRHSALTLGEEDPDYIIFGRFGMDTHPEPHKRNIALADWWSKVVEVPCILMGGSSLETLEQAAETGAEFVALSQAVLGEDIDAAMACRKANSILENFVFEDEAA